MQITERSSHPALTLTDGVAMSAADFVLLVGRVLLAWFSTHAYWTFTDAGARRIQDMIFYKNISMLGGILYLFVAGPGGLSLDRWLAKR